MLGEHPSDRTLGDYLDGRCNAEPASAIADHLRECELCRVRAKSSTLEYPRGQAPVARAAAGRPATAVGVSRPAARPVAPLPTLPDYELIRHLGSGGMGVLYLSKNLIMNRLEALKVVASHLTENPRVMERFLREIQSAAMLQHRNIVAAYAAIRWGGGLILSMEFVDGTDLATEVERRGPLPVAEACFHTFQVAQGLRHAQSRGMVHRDIKPANLMLDRAGGKGLVKILDFGLAKVASEQTNEPGLTHPGGMLGTPDYVAPEQIRRASEADIRADIYSLGCTLYFLLSGRPPFHGPNVWDILQAHHSTDAFPLNQVRADVPGELAALVAKMMAKDPEARFQTPAEVAEALLPFFKTGAPIAGSPTPGRMTTAPGAPQGTLLEAPQSLAPPAPQATLMESVPFAGAALPGIPFDSIAVQDQDREEEDDEYEEEEVEGRPAWITAAAILVPIAVVALVFFMFLPRRSGPVEAGTEPTKSEDLAANFESPNPATDTDPDKSDGFGFDGESSGAMTSGTDTDALGSGRFDLEDSSEEAELAESDPEGEADAGEEIELAGGNGFGSPAAQLPDEEAEPEPEPERAGVEIEKGPDGLVHHDFERVASAPGSYQGLLVKPTGYFKMSMSLDRERVPGYATITIEDSHRKTLSDRWNVSKDGMGLILDGSLAKTLDKYRSDAGIPSSVKVDQYVIPTFEVVQMIIQGENRWVGVIHSLETLFGIDKRRVAEGDIDDGFAIAFLEENRYVRAESRGDEWYSLLGGEKLRRRYKKEIEDALKAVRQGKMRREALRQGQAMWDQAFRGAQQQSAAEQQRSQDMYNRLFRR